MRRFCSAPGCTVIVDKGRCPIHGQPFEREPGVHYGRRWQREARAYLAEPEHVWCALCPPGSTTLATEVDHIQPHEGKAALFWDRANWQPACRPCNSAKGGRYGGGNRGG